ncbi:hypothetical protein PR048_013295 [Dryococelus australis]|uniref:HAT C-terminal dimerisation domain-containing protein n=1 Tax=Dryococelus australis TaxID=614101 RepID=A0ABQ9HSI6_9NEOP|nr:hypothetical protein PR048_013295 [Dryococelus australis]
MELSGSQSDEHLEQYLSKKVVKICNMYMGFIGKLGAFVLHAKYKLWREHWVTAKNVNSTITQKVLDTVDNCKKDMFPNIHKLLLLLATLPISVATAECSFSSLWWLKTWLHNGKGEELLNGLVLLHFHRYIDANKDSIINDFAKKKYRHIDYILSSLLSSFALATGVPSDSTTQVYSLRHEQGGMAAVPRSCRSQCTSWVGSVCTSSMLSAGWGPINSSIPLLVSARHVYGGMVAGARSGARPGTEAYSGATD